MTLTDIKREVQDIVDSADERELWIVGREFERPPYFHAGKGGDTRLARALRVCVEGRITPNSDGSYTVEGSEHRTYRVTNSCSCPQSQKANSKFCYHYVAVCLWIEWQRRLKPLAPTFSPVALGTLRAGTAPLPPTAPDDDELGNGYPIDDETLPLPLPPTSIDERLAAAPVAQEDRMADDGYLHEPDTDNAPVAVLEAADADSPPLGQTATRPLPGPVLLPSLDAQSLKRSMQEWSAQRQVIRSFLQQELKEGVDFYRLQVRGKDATPTLSKAGAEKFLGLFQLQASFAPDLLTWEMLGKPTDHIIYICTLRTRNGEIVGEGRGSRSLKKDSGDTNKAIKMSEKCLGGTTPILIRSPYGITRTLLNKLEGRDLSKLWIAGPHGTWRKLIRVARQPLGPVRRLLFRDGLQVMASLEHRWPLVDGTLIDTASLRVGDCVQRSLLPTGIGQADPDYTWMAGLFVAEGWLLNERTIRFSLHSKEEDLAARLRQIAERLGAHCSLTIEGNKQTVALYGPAPVGLVEQFVQGRLSYGKHFTGYLFRQDTKGLMSALSGYLAGDGGYAETHGRQPYWELGFTRKNHALAHDLRALCAMVGYRCRLGLGTAAIRSAGKVFDTYRGWIKPEPPHYNGADLGRIMDIGEGAEVTYEVEVDGDHLFCLANGLVTHNSALIDAVLRTGALSEVYTQDVEDLQEEPTPTPAKPTPAQPSSQELRRRIWATVAAQAPQQATTREAVSAWIMQVTGHELVPDNYAAIVAALERRA
jgi:hypothetical protein